MYKRLKINVDIKNTRVVQEYITSDYLQPFSMYVVWKSERVEALIGFLVYL